MAEWTMADLGEKEKITKEEIDELKRQASEFLSSRYFYAASDLYKRILENNPNDKDGHLGLLMTANKITDEEDLIRYYQDLYSDEEYEIRLAAEKEDSHVKEMCERYRVEDYYDDDAIRKTYDFDLTYKSAVYSRKRQKEEITDLIDSDEHLSWLKRNGFREILDILKAYDQRIEKAEESDRENASEVKSEYQRFLYKAYSDVKASSVKAKEKREKDYKDLIREYESCSDIDRLQEISLRFERFKDFKDAKKYVGLCDEKIEAVRSDIKDKSFKQIIDNSLDEAKAALVTGKFSDAFDGFTKITSMDPENEEANLGILMARARVMDEDELFAYYKDLYNEETRETLEACEEDLEHIEEMAEKYYLPDYLEKGTIYEKYAYDRTYKSLLNARIKQENRFKEETLTDPVFQWLKKNGSDTVKKKIQELYDIYALRVKEANEEDRKKAEQIRGDYQRFLFKTYSSIKKLYKKACDRKEESYRQLVRAFDLAVSINELNELIGKFEDLGEYKECGKYINLCREKIKELKDREDADHVDQDIETALIAGRAYLASDNEELAQESFDKVLSMDPNSPRAYLGILMLETGSKDIDELTDYYKNLYIDDESQVLEACEEEKDHVEAMAEKYAIPGYLEKETIEKYYGFDRSYSSLTASRKRQRDQFVEELRMNPLLAKVAAGKDEEIVSFISEVKDSYEARIEEAKEEDERQIASLRHIYDVYLLQSDKSVLNIYEQKLKQKNEDCETVYLKNIEEFNKDLNEEELEALCNAFDLDYKDGPVYIKRCKDRIREMRKAREADKLASLLENGTALLESELFEEAKKRFDSYLEIDPENEEVHLKLLMAEKKVTNVTDLFNHYKDLYSDEILETKVAVEENKEHIESIVEKCYLPELLEKEDIRKRYFYDRTYESLLEARLVQKQQIEDEIAIDPGLSWLRENGTDKARRFIADLLEAYDQRIEEAKEEDEYLVDTIRKEYRAFVRDTDREVRSLYSELNKERNKKLKEQEKEKKEFERRQKEEAERQKRFEEAETRRLQQLKEELEQRERLLLEEQKRIEEENRRREAEEKQRQLLEKQKNVQQLQEQKKTVTAHTRPLQNAIAQREKLEKEASLKLEKEKQKLAKQEQARQAKLLKEEQRKKREEEKAQKASEKASRKKERKPFRPNYALTAAALSLGLLTFVVYTFVIEPNNKYKNAMELVEQGNYDDAIAVFEDLGNYKDSEYQIKETTYKKADALYGRGEQIEAAKIFNNLRFNDSEDRVKAIKEELIDNAKIGDTIYFGDYEQDGDNDNGKEMIEWIVLDEQEGSILVISRYGLEAQAFNSDSDEVYWENSSLRSWLNGRFPDNAFSREAPSDVLQTTLINYKYPPQEDENEDVNELILEEYETRDRLFLLSTQELEQYFPEEASRICEATYYAIENGVAASADNTCSWWLRSAGNGRDMFEFVWNQYGTVASSMQILVQAVRPVMWIKTD